MAAAFGPSGAQAAPQPLGTLWSNGTATVEITGCTPSSEHDDYCRAIGLRRGGRLQILGEGYMRVDLLWSRRGGPTGPDVVVRGESGGSGGHADIVAVDLSRGTATRKLSLDRGDTIAAAGAGPLRIEAPFVVGGFNGAPHSEDTIVPVPLVWSDGDFHADVAALTARPFPAGDLRFRELAVREELNRWRNDLETGETIYPAPPNALGGTPTTVSALVELMLSGRPEEAHAILHRAWPRSRERTDVPAGGEATFWADLCRAVARRDDWRRLGLDRLPHAGLIEAAVQIRAVAVR